MTRNDRNFNRKDHEEYTKRVINGTKYVCSGVRRTGFLDDEY